MDVLLIMLCGRLPPVSSFGDMDSFDLELKQQTVEWWFPSHGKRFHDAVWCSEGCTSCLHPSSLCLTVLFHLVPHLIVHTYCAISPAWETTKTVGKWHTFPMKQHFVVKVICKACCRPGVMKCWLAHPLYFPYPPSLLLFVCKELCPVDIQHIIYFPKFLTCYCVFFLFNVSAP